MITNTKIEVRYAKSGCMDVYVHEPERSPRQLKPNVWKPYGTGFIDWYMAVCVLPQTAEYLEFTNSKGETVRTPIFRTNA